MLHYAVIFFVIAIIAAVMMRPSVVAALLRC